MIAMLLIVIGMVIVFTLLPLLIKYVVPLLYFGLAGLIVAGACIVYGGIVYLLTGRLF